MIDRVAETLTHPENELGWIRSAPTITEQFTSVSMLFAWTISVSGHPETHIETHLRFQALFTKRLDKNEINGE